MDKLAAISGIAGRTRRILGYDYPAGLWGKDIEYQLLWKVDTWSPRASKLTASRASSFVAPTWSWASINGVEVEFLYRDEFRFGPKKQYMLSHVIEAKVSPADSTTLCNDGHLLLQCFLVPIEPDFANTNKLTLLTHDSQDSERKIEAKAPTNIDTPITNTHGKDFWCAPILDSLGHDDNAPFRSVDENVVQGLVLCLLKKKREEDVVFCRCGYFRLKKRDEDIYELRDEEKGEFWKAVFEYGESASSAGESGIALYDQVLEYKIGSDGKRYGVFGVPQFRIVIK